MRVSRTAILQDRLNVVNEIKRILGMTDEQLREETNQTPGGYACEGRRDQTFHLIRYFILHVGFPLGEIE